MTRHVHASRHSRAGITLTEILISILIMGIGLISLATLFPLGILRLRSASRDNRSALLGESALSELMTRNLLAKSSFTNVVSNPWYASSAAVVFGPNNISYDPWTQDLSSYLVSVPTNLGVFKTTGPGLPVCYDPFFRAFATNPNGPPDISVNTTPGVYPGAPWGEARFGYGPFLKSGADGLQRITNFDMTMPPRGTYGASSKAVPPTLANSGPNLLYHTRMLDTVSSIFASPDDVVTYASEGTQAASGKSPLIPDLYLNPVTPLVPSITRDFSYTWFFTGLQTDASNPNQYDGSIVVCNNRPLAVDVVTLPNGASTYAVAGETTVGAIWGYGTVLAKTFPAQTQGYAAGADRTVLLYWPAAIEDPEVKVGQWICDVTYERLLGNSSLHTSAAQTIANAVEGQQFLFPNKNIPDFPVYEAQRCLWYQVIKRSDISQIDPSTGKPIVILGTNVRTMTVQVGGTLRAKTMLHAAASSSLPLEPVYSEAALIMPSVVNVFPKSISTR